MTQREDAAEVARFKTALTQFIGRVAEDRYVLAVVLVGSLSPETIWARETLGLWIIEADGVSRRLPSDGENERIFRILVENGINIHAEVIARARFKKMVEGMSRTAFSCNFFAHREIVYSKDPSIDSWFKKANAVAIKDQERELLVFSTWTIHELRHAQSAWTSSETLNWRRRESSPPRTASRTPKSSGGVGFANKTSSTAQWKETPELFQTIYIDVLAKRKNRRVLSTALDAIDGYLDEHYQAYLKPLLGFLKKHNRVIPLSEISDHFAFSQMHPGHLEAACEWLERKGLLQKVSAPFKLTKRSIEQVEEPAYFLEV